MVKHKSRSGAVAGGRTSGQFHNALAAPQVNNLDPRDVQPATGRSISPGPATPRSNGWTTPIVADSSATIPGAPSDVPPDLQGVPNAAKSPSSQAVLEATALSSNFHTAIALSAVGIPVFPVKLHQPTGATRCNKKPLIAGWKSAATTDTNQIRAWWSKFPRAAPGVPCGHPNLNLVVVDVDRHDDGHDGVGAFQYLEITTSTFQHIQRSKPPVAVTTTFSVSPRVSRLVTGLVTSPKELMCAV